MGGDGVPEVRDEGIGDGGDEEVASRRSQRTSWAHEEEEPLKVCGACSCGELTCLSWCFLVFVLVIAVSIVMHNPKDAALLPGFFLAPMLVLYVVWYRRLRRQIPVNLVLQNFAFGFLPGACIVMVVELLLSAIFFLICFNDQLGGWFNSVTHDGGGSLRSLASPSGGWGSALAVVASMCFRAPGARWAPLHRPGMAAVAAVSARHTTAGRGAAASGGGHPHGGPGSAAAREDVEEAAKAVDPIAVLSKMYGISIQRTPGLYLFVFLLAFVVAAGTEETLKYLTPLRFRACKHSSCPYVYLVCAVACALGFSTVENIGYTFQASGGGGNNGSTAVTWTPAPNAHMSTPTGAGGLETPVGSHAGAGEEDVALDFTARAYTAYSRAVVAIAAHSLFGALVGLGLTKRQIIPKAHCPPSIFTIQSHWTLTFQKFGHRLVLGQPLYHFSKVSTQLLNLVNCRALPLRICIGMCSDSPCASEKLLKNPLSGDFMQ
jgi:RsiW-degrading membrane proteinase PrsW (M82 family)